MKPQKQEIITCPSCGDEHGIHSAESPNNTTCGFSEIAPLLSDVALCNWAWGSNSGVMKLSISAARNKKGTRTPMKKFMAKDNSAVKLSLYGRRIKNENIFPAATDRKSVV